MANASTPATAENYSIAQVCDIAGKEMIQLSLINTVTIDVSGLGDGLYQLRLCGGGGVVTRMFVVKR